MSDGPDESKVRALARKYALQNAVQHGGSANPGAVVGKIMGEAADLRPHSKTIMPWIQDETKQVNGLDPGAQKAELESLDPSLLEKKKKERGHPFKTLPGYDDHDEVVMRFAPNPNGPATLGHSRGMVTMAEYKRIAEEDGKKGTLVLRYDDTDPQVKPPYLPAYDWIAEDYAWLGAEVDRKVLASDRIEEYYKVVEALLDKDAAYVCTCTQEDAKAHRDAGKPCPHRGRDTETQKADWKKMLGGGFGEGEATLRVKTQVDHKDPALRDWVGLRIVETPHPRVGDKFRVWPMLDFESAVEDHLQGVTHIIRGKDLRDSTHRQRFLYDHMGWKYPETLYWGRVRLDEIGRFSSSGMRKDIDAGRFTGWDDPRLPTLRALRRRGIRAEALRAFWVGMGLSEKDVAASLVNLYAENEKLVEPEADRLFFVHDPVTVTVKLPDDHGSWLDEEGALVASTPVHPDHAERGVRTNRVPVADATAKVFLARADVEGRRPGDLVRLKDLGNIRFESVGSGLEDPPQAVWAGDDLDEARKAKAPIVQWVSTAPGSHVETTVLRPEPSDEPDGVRHHGLAEAHITSYKADRIIQFERYGFVRLEEVTDGGVQAVFAHR